MIERCILLFIFSLTVNSEKIDDIFTLDADDVIISEVGEDFYEMRKRLQSLPYDDTTTFSPLSEQDDSNRTKTAASASERDDSNGTKTAASTTEKISAASVPPEIAAKFANTTLRDIKRRRFKLQIDRLLSSNRSVTDYLTDTDVSTLTTKVDKIIEESKKKGIIRTRRETYWNQEERHMKWNVKRRYMNLITHFVFITRYKLVYPQVLRKKYHDSHQYRLGFLFALLRHLKNMQKWIHWAMSSHGQYVDGSIYYNIKMYEKILRLDVDIKDVILLITKTEYHRNLKYNPKFYDYEAETYD